MGRSELVNLPRIGSLVRCTVSLFHAPEGTTGRITAILSGDDSPTVVIESSLREEITVYARDYPCFFEEYPGN